MVRAAPAAVALCLRELCLVPPKPTLPGPPCLPEDPLPPRPWGCSSPRRFPFPTRSALALPMLPPASAGSGSFSQPLPRWNPAQEDFQRLSYRFPPSNPTLRDAGVPGLARAAGRFLRGAGEGGSGECPPAAPGAPNTPGFCPNFMAGAQERQNRRGSPAPGGQSHRLRADPLRSPRPCPTSWAGRWSGRTGRAALILGAVLSATQQHPDLPAAVPQGFQCIPAGDLPAADVLAFAQGLQNTTLGMSGAQLSCLARLLTAKNLTADFGRYPPDLLLFFDSPAVGGGTCRAFYARASRGNLDLLPRGSARRRGLLRGAMACLGVRSSRLRREQLSSLGALVCDMEPETIAASDPGVLENLKLCPVLTGAQRDVLNAVLLGGGTAYGDPSRWDLRTLQNLGPLVLALNQTTLSSVAEAARDAFGSSIAAAYGSQRRPQREKSLTLLRAFAAASASSHPRLKRSADRCLSAPITARTISDPFLLIHYDTSEQFDLCLSNEVLKANLEPLLQQPLTVEYLQVIKTKLEQIYPSGIPEEQLKMFGPLSRQYTVEISLWPVTSGDTLSALLDPSDGKWGASQVQQLVSRYLALGGTLTGPLLWKIGGRNLCNLQEEQINQISPEAIRTAGPLNVSSCSQIKKDQLYRKAREAFAGQAGTPRAYYCRIWPYLGGAPAKDLKELAKAGVAVDMDVDTFLALNPDELQKLSVTDVKNLLGENLPHLKEAENETSVMRWVKGQSQRELDCTLGIGLQGGMEEPSPAGTATPPRPTASASVPAPPTPTVPAPTTLPTAPTPTAVSSPPTTNPSTSPPTASPPTAPSPGSPTPPNTAAGTPTVTSTTRPAPTTGSILPCSVHQSATPHQTTPPAATHPPPPAVISPNATSPGSVPAPALTHGATTVTKPPVATSTALVPTTPPAPGGTANPSTHSAPSTLPPEATAATTATGMNVLPHKPTTTPNSTVPTQKSVISSTAETTTLACETRAPPALLGPSSTTAGSETTKKPPAAVPEPPRPPGGYINVQPEAGSGSRLSSCLVHLLTTAVGSWLLRGLL
ncbi:mesothelin-like [Opisthocomus hoazin]|uniref:mesothelin-like n=1 Tax=Opisthocomus hoazin TaxID=30419 RepID=UPI003F53B853